MPRAALALAAVLALAVPALAEGPLPPPVGPEGEDPVEAIKRAAIKVSKALKESEEALTKVSRGEIASPQGADISLPKSEQGPPKPKPPEGGT